VFLRKVTDSLAKASGDPQLILRSAVWLCNNNLLLEAKDDSTAIWLHTQANMNTLKQDLGIKATAKPRAHNVIAFFVPLMLDMDDQTHRDEVAEANNINPRSIIKYRWSKPPAKHTPGQQVRHLNITFSSTDTANYVILNRLVICNKKVSVAKDRKEPIRCLKCQAYDHVATECIIAHDICAHYGDRGHKIANCQS
jgi:hypothetical protein